VQTRSIPAPPSIHPITIRHLLFFLEFRVPRLPRLPRCLSATLPLCHSAPPISHSSTTRSLHDPTHLQSPPTSPTSCCVRSPSSLSCRSLILSFPLSWRSFPPFPSFHLVHHHTRSHLRLSSIPSTSTSISRFLSLATYIPPPNTRPSLTLVERDLWPHSCPRRESVPVAIQARCHHYTTTHIDDNKTKTNEHYIPAHPSHTLNPTPTLASQTIFNHRSVKKKDKHLQPGQIPPKPQCPSQA